MNKDSPPRPNLKEIRERVARVMEPHLFEMLDRHKDDCPYCQSARTFAMRQADRAIEATGIDSLLSERDEARAALEPFAEESRAFEGDVSDDLHLTVRDEDGETVNTTISVGDLRRAARAMRGREGRGVSAMSKTEIPAPRLAEIPQFVKDLRDPVNQTYGGFNARAADLIDSLLSERDEAAAREREECAKLAEVFWKSRGTHIANAIRAMRGNAE